MFRAFGYRIWEQFPLIYTNKVLGRKLRGNFATRLFRLNNDIERVVTRNGSFLFVDSRIPDETKQSERARPFQNETSLRCASRVSARRTSIVNDIVRFVSRKVQLRVAGGSFVDEFLVSRRNDADRSDRASAPPFAEIVATEAINIGSSRR